MDTEQTSERKKYNAARLKQNQKVATKESDEGQHATNSMKEKEEDGIREAEKKSERKERMRTQRGNKTKTLIH